MKEPEYDPHRWIFDWPHDKQPVWESWREVHARFGIAAQTSSQIETGLSMIIAQAKQVIGGNFEFQGLLDELSKCAIPLGALIPLFKNIFRVSEEEQISKELKRSKDIRNYLIHHFYRDRAELFYSPEGCDEAVETLVSYNDEFQACLDTLKQWSHDKFGKIDFEEEMDQINEDVRKWKEEQQSMLDSLLGKNERWDNKAVERNF